jgi:hypothetical protein
VYDATRRRSPGRDHRARIEEAKSVSTSLPPPKSSGGGNAKYAVVGLLLLIGASVAIYFGRTVLVHDAGPPAPIGPTVGVQIQLPLEEPDAGQPAAAPDAGGRHIRYVYRYVSACPGSVDGSRVSAVVRQNYGGLRECYNRELRSNPQLRGNVTAEWTIQPSGNVGQVVTSGAVTHDHTFKSCFESALSRLRFPPPHGGCATFQQSFTFTPGS